MTATNVPGLRRSGAMAFDPTQNRLLLHGGLNLSPSPILAETVAFTGTAFTPLAPTTTPPARWGHAMATDEPRGVIVCFGGRSPDFYIDANDTWEWDGSDWRHVITPHSPPPRMGHGLVYDIARARCVLFGGVDVDGARSDTWEYFGSDWSQVTTAERPPAREGAVFVHDPTRRVSVLHAGQDAGPPVARFADTWEYDGTTWRRIFTTTTPPARYRAAGVFDQGRSRVVAYGGYGTSIVQETWEYDGQEWRNPAGGGTGYATEMFAAYLPSAAALFTYGGGGPLGVTNETWRYQGAMAASWGLFGRGCPGGSTTPQLVAGSLPVLGATFLLDVTAMPETTPVCLLAQGLTASSWNGMPLPLDLGPFGATGCQLEVAPDFLVILSAANGIASQVIPIPNTPSLAGLLFYAQAFVPDPTAPNGLGSMTVAGRGVLGS